MTTISDRWVLDIVAYGYSIEFGHKVPHTRLLYLPRNKFLKNTKLSFRRYNISWTLGWLNQFRRTSRTLLNNFNSSQKERESQGHTRSAMAKQICEYKEIQYGDTPVNCKLDLRELFYFFNLFLWGLLSYSYQRIPSQVSEVRPWQKSLPICGTPLQPHVIPKSLHQSISNPCSLPENTRCVPVFLLGQSPHLVSMPDGCDSNDGLPWMAWISDQQEECSSTNSTDPSLGSDHR